MIVAIKVAIVLLVIIAGVTYSTRPTGPRSSRPPARCRRRGASTTTLAQDIGIGTGTFGIGGIFSGAALVFFAFIGFDIVATAAEETKNPQRDLPIGIFGSLAICTTLYVLVSLVVTGMVPYNQISVEAPLAEAFNSVGNDTIAQIVSGVPSPA